MKLRSPASKLKISALAIFIALAVCPYSGLADSDLPTGKTDAFFKQILAGDIDGAYNHLFAGSSIPENKPQAVAYLKQQTTSALSLYGKPLGYELIRKEHFGRSLTRVVYILHTKMLPIVWELFFYKPKDSWFLVNIVFNDKFNLLDAKNR